MRWVAAVAIAAAVLGGCRRGTGESLTAQAAVEVQQWRFPHRTHSDVGCTDCHGLQEVIAGRPARPGANDHAPCDRDACHRDEFTRAPSSFCTHCHSDVDASGNGPSPLAPYPPTSGRRLLASDFDHQRHLDQRRMENQVGFHVDCADCHQLRNDGTHTLPGHAACGRCHAKEAAPGDVPTLERCPACHRERARPPLRERVLIVGDLRFSHANHRKTADTQPIRCSECHRDIGESRATGAHRPPPTSACSECHDDPLRTPTTLRMRECETCHIGRAESFGTLAPRSHLPPLETPTSHTLAFRSDHSAAARNNAVQCARCHTEMSGSPQAACDECHQIMRPQNHTIGWREFDHGPQAAVDSQPCVTCHAGGFCVACHSRPPRSHFPLADFARGGHAALADVNLRSCFVCHPSRRDCTTVGCHTGGPRP